MAEDISKKFKILCVDDDEDIIELYKVYLDKFGFAIDTACDGLMAAQKLEKDSRNTIMVISDYKMPGLNGFELREMLAENWSDVPFMIVSGFFTKEDMAKAMELGVRSVLEKPVDEKEFLRIVGSILTPRVEEMKDEWELLEGFLNEAEMMLEELENLVSEVEHGNHEISTFDRIFAIVHTIKGTSGFFTPDTIHKYSHKFEDLLAKVRDGSVVISDSLVSVMYRAVDQINKLVTELKSGVNIHYELNDLTKEFVEFLQTGQLSATTEKRELPKSGSSGNKEEGKSVSSPKAREDVRVPIQLLDEFMGMSGEITVLRNMIIKLVSVFEKSYGANKDIQHLGELLEEMHKVNSIIQDKIMQLRKVPVSDILRPLNRVVRDVAPRLGKNVQMESRGKELMVDAAIAEVLNSSLIHMIRNCVDHGIETPELRIEKGKPEQGTVIISAREMKEEVVVEISDDGAGMDPEVISKKAIEKGLVTASDLSMMSSSEVFSLVLAPGFSTAAQVTDISGRGVGTDMLKGSVEKLGGSIVIDSELGKGTKFTLNLPVPKSTLIISALSVSIGGETIAIPQEDIIRVIEIPREDKQQKIQELQGDCFVMDFEGEHIPVLFPKDLFKLNDNRSLNEVSEFISYIVIQTKLYKFCIEVDEIFDVEDTVVKKSNNLVKALENFMGATFLGDGNLGLIFSMDKVAELAGLTPHLQIPKEDVPRTAPEQGISGDPAVGKSKMYVLVKVNETSEMAFPMKDVFRLEEFHRDRMRYIAEQEAVIYRQRATPIYSLAEILQLPSGVLHTQKELPTMIVESNHQQSGLYVHKILNLVETDGPIHTEVADRLGIIGNLVYQGKSYPVVDLKELMVGIKLNRNPIHLKEVVA